MHCKGVQLVVRYAASGACAAVVLCLFGCAGITENLSLPVTSAIPRGSLYGGLQPIVGAKVYVYAANTSGGYGSASTSLMQAGTGTATDLSGNTYVVTDAAGSFSYAGTVTCPTSTTQVYLLAVGGNGISEPGVDNTAIDLTAALGNCSGVSASTFTRMNEVTTAAMAFALQAFAVDATHIGSPSSNSNGLVNAFATVANLADSASGLALTATPAGNGIAPQATLNTLANIAANCANSAGNTSAACASVFSHTSTVGGTPKTVFTALLNIAAFPASQPAGLFSDALLTSAFEPALAQAPNDFSLGITYSPTAITAVKPEAVVIAANGNIWMASCASCQTPSAIDSLLEFSPTGVFLQSFTGSALPGVPRLHHIKGIAIDATSTYIYTVNQGVPGGTIPGTGDDQLVKMDLATGTIQNGFPIEFDQSTYGVGSFNGITIDNSGETWTTAPNAGAIVETSSSGNLINGSPFFVGATLGAATDNIGNIWFAGVGGNNLIQFDTNGNFLNNYTPPGLIQPAMIAINGSDELWTVNMGNQSVSKIESFNGRDGGGSPYTGLGIGVATVTAIDGASQVFIPNCRLSCGNPGDAPDNLLRLAQSGEANTGGSGTDSGIQNSSFNGPIGAAADASGNVWVANNLSGTLTEIISFAAPTIQPLAAASTTGNLGQLP